MYSSEDFRTLLNNSWLNGTVIDALLLTYVTNEIGYIPVKVSNSIWSSTKVQIAKFDWTKYCVLFLPINPEENCTICNLRFTIKAQVIK
ncbi:hypothetical protein ACI65C_007271 [Semiaphis heraclei]